MPNLQRQRPLTAGHAINHTHRPRVPLPAHMRGLLQSVLGAGRPILQLADRHPRPQWSNRPRHHPQGHLHHIRDTRYSHLRRRPRVRSSLHKRIPIRMGGSTTGSPRRTTPTRTAGPKWPLKLPNASSPATQGLEGHSSIRSTRLYYNIETTPAQTPACPQHDASLAGTCETCSPESPLASNLKPSW